MDELRFRASRSLEELQVRGSMAAERIASDGMRVAREYSDEARRAFNGSSTLDSAREVLDNVKNNLLALIRDTKRFLSEIADPERISEALFGVFRDEITRNYALLLLFGLGAGATGGFMLGVWWTRPRMAEPIMKAVACVSFRNSDNVTICQMNIPHMRDSSDILVRVKAASIMRLDDRIARGYGRVLRCCIQRYNSYHPELPLVLGRSCSGVVEAVGKSSRSGLDIGDEVWIASPWFDAGLASDYVVVPESHVARKPFVIGFEGAASLPYSGSVALEALYDAGLDEKSTQGKRILIEDGCSAVGVVLTQLTKRWGAKITATCHSRSAPVVKALEERGADDIISFSNEAFTQTFYDSQIAQSNFINELTSREPFDVIFLTTELKYDQRFLQKFLTHGGRVVDTVEPELASDEFSYFMQVLFGIGIRLKRLGCALLRREPEWSDVHICHATLDRLADFVNDGVLQTVVDQVYSPHEADRALAHVLSDKRIGSTLITFR